MLYIVYETTNKINQKFYVGKHKTKNLEDGYLGSGKILNRAIAKYGEENFKRKVLHIFDSEKEMNEKEAEIVTEDFCLREDTYNLCVGGRGGFSYINRNKINGPGFAKGNLASKRGTEQLLEMLKNPEYKKKWSETRSKSLKGRAGTFNGRKHSEETKRKISISAKNRRKKD